MTSGPRAAAALATGEDLVAAAERAVAEVRAALGGVTPDLALVFVSSVGDPHDAQAALERATEVLQAHSVVGCDAHGVIAAGQARESEPAVSVWAAVLPGVRVRAFHLEVLRGEDSLAVVGMPTRQVDDVVGVLLADPWSFPVDGFVEHSSDSLGGLPLVGGVSSGAEGPGAARLLVDGVVHRRGAVGVVLGGAVAARAVVSQGCRAIGAPMTVTAAEGPVVQTLAGGRALDRAREAVESLPPEEQALAVRGLQLGVARDDYALGDDAADYVVRGIVGADDVAGSITVGDVVPVGRTVRFHLRDADAAESDLNVVMDAFAATLDSPAAGALLFSCNGRGRAMFPDPGHDVSVVCRALGTRQVGGFFAAGEIGPVGGSNFLHAFTATVAVFA
jgi:small ligand-binding sensory domain FIST